jgi:hypothetical protein
MPCHVTVIGAEHQVRILCVRVIPTNDVSALVVVAFQVEAPLADGQVVFDFDGRLAAGAELPDE